MENLIRRAAAGLGIGVSATDMAAKLMETNEVSAEDAFLAVRAAEILITSWGPQDRMTIPDIPISKRPPAK